VYACRSQILAVKEVLDRFNWGNRLANCAVRRRPLKCMGLIIGDRDWTPPRVCTPTPSLQPKKGKNKVIYGLRREKLGLELSGAFIELAD
jgi:hypothetical protein